ncbi:hypothetical protein [Mogibacterium pumilum]|uniref:Conjugal transfer protein n=1 Tax=Mogibacterium pumilum TaxID=86332 RepID=A0A223ASK6_9FIRM|nr:hypothetical protein [Mogibacterium pumilum]ASS37942.1 hypothetical protein AXF17_05515 [Mogibacterium pumilum]
MAKEISMLFMIILQFALGTAGLMELVWHLSGRDSTMNPYMSGISALVFYTLGIRSILMFVKRMNNN